MNIDFVHSLYFYQKIKMHNAGVPIIDSMYTAANDEEVSFGAIVGKDGNKLYIAPMNADNILPNFADVRDVSLENKSVICYEYDSAKAVYSRCGIGNVDDISVDFNLAGDYGNSTGYEIRYGNFSSINPVAGMLDYAYVLKRGLKTEVVVYKQRPYDYEVFE